MKIFIIVLLFFITIRLNSQISEEIELRTIDEYRQEKSFKKAKSQTKKSELIKSFEKITKDYPDSYHGQLSLLELAKLNILGRHYEKAIEQLKEIHLPEIVDKQYWLAKANLKVDKYQLAIVSAQIYISDSNEYEKIEVAYFIIAEAYINQKMYKRAFNTLETLRTSKYIKNNIPLLHYKMGNCKELMGKYEDALICYKKLKQDFPYHQYSYLAEDRIFNLIKGNKINIDLAKINSYRQTEPKQETKAATGEDLKIYLQVGAFGSEENAEKLGEKVKKIGYDFIVFSKIKDNQKLYVVAVGPFEKDSKLKKAMKKLEKNDLKSFVIKRY